LSFAALQRRVQRRARLFEGRTELAVARWQALHADWREAWTPGRIVVVGLVSGFLLGRSHALREIGGAGAVQLIKALSALLATPPAPARPGPEPGDAEPAATMSP
jgi:hypothetical protein